MDFPQSVVSPVKGAFSYEKQNSHLSMEDAGSLSRENGVRRKDVQINNFENIFGVLEVYIHQARDIHNICIYHKQDVYAKLCITTDLENTVFTKTINGGGKNPVFNEALRVSVRTIEGSLKCEIWMLSKAKNYLEDQLLGFALVPLTDVLLSNGKLEKEFSLSSTDLFHSPAGFVQLSLAYCGTSPEVIPIPAPAASIDAAVQDVGPHESVPCELDKIEFPDPLIACENHKMASEYFGIPCTDLDSDNQISSELGSENQITSELGVQFLERFSTCSINSSQITKVDSPCVSTASHNASIQSFDKSSNEDYASHLEGNSKEKNAQFGAAESNASVTMPNDMFMTPLVSVTFKPEQKVVQQDIVDMYMKSMQQFTESLTKMKLPLDMDNGSMSTISTNSTSDQKSQAAKNPGSRVFYGSRAFF